MAYTSGEKKESQTNPIQRKSRWPCIGPNVMKSSGIWPVIALQQMLS